MRKPTSYTLEYDGRTYDLEYDGELTPEAAMNIVSMAVDGKPFSGASSLKFPPVIARAVGKPEGTIQEFSAAAASGALGREADRLPKPGVAANIAKRTITRPEPGKTGIEPPVQNMRLSPLGGGKVQPPGSKPPHPAADPKPNPKNARELARWHARNSGIDEAIFEGLVGAESGFNPRAVSKVGAQGLGQLMPGTAKALGVADPFDPDQNLKGATQYLKSMLHRYKGDYALALAAYNAGPGNVDKYKGIPPFKETVAYVNKILGTGYRIEKGKVVGGRGPVAGGMKSSIPIGSKLDVPLSSQLGEIAMDLGDLPVFGPKRSAPRTSVGQAIARIESLDIDLRHAAAAMMQEKRLRAKGDANPKIQIPTKSGGIMYLSAFKKAMADAIGVPVASIDINAISAVEQMLDTGGASRRARVMQESGGTALDFDSGFQQFLASMAPSSPGQALQSVGRTLSGLPDILSGQMAGAMGGDPDEVMQSLDSPVRRLGSGAFAIGTGIPALAGEVGGAVVRSFEEGGPAPIDESIGNMMRALDPSPLFDGDTWTQDRWDQAAMLLANYAALGYGGAKGAGRIASTLKTRQVANTLRQEFPGMVQRESFFKRLHADVLKTGKLETPELAQRVADITGVEPGHMGANSIIPRDNMHRIAERIVAMARWEVSGRKGPKPPIPEVLDASGKPVAPTRAAFARLKEEVAGFVESQIADLKTDASPRAVSAAVDRLLGEFVDAARAKLDGTLPGSVAGSAAASGGRPDPETPPETPPGTPAPSAKPEPRPLVADTKPPRDTRTQPVASLDEFKQVAADKVSNAPGDAIGSPVAVKDGDFRAWGVVKAQNEDGTVTIARFDGKGNIVETTGRFDDAVFVTPEFFKEVGESIIGNVDALYDWQPPASKPVPDTGAPAPVATPEPKPVSTPEPKPASAPEPVATPESKPVSTPEPSAPAPAPDAAKPAAVAEPGAKPRFTFEFDRPKPVVYDVDRPVFTGEVNGQPWWTDRNMALKGDPPDGATMGSFKPDIGSVVRNVHGTPAEIVAFVPGGDDDVPDRIALITDDGRYKFIDARFYGVVVERFPDATFELPGENQGVPVRVFSGDEPVGVIMPYELPGRDEGLAYDIRAARSGSATPVVDPDQPLPPQPQAAPQTPDQTKGPAAEVADEPKPEDKPETPEEKKARMKREAAARKRQKVVDVEPEDEAPDATVAEPRTPAEPDGAATEIEPDAPSQPEPSPAPASEPTPEPKPKPNAASSGEPAMDKTPLLAGDGEPRSNTGKHRRPKGRGGKVPETRKVEYLASESGRRGRDQRVPAGLDSYILVDDAFAVYKDEGRWSVAVIMPEKWQKLTADTYEDSDEAVVVVDRLTSLPIDWSGPFMEHIGPYIAAVKAIAADPYIDDADIPAPAAKPAGDYVMSQATKDRVSKRTENEMVDDLVEALQALRTAEKRGYATEEEREALARFPGFGFAGPIMDDRNAEPGATHHENYVKMRAVMDDAEWASGLVATMNSHYTSPEGVEYAWKAIEKLGVEFKHILEPSFGIGHFKSLAPEWAQKAKWTAVELDSLSARIGKLLHPSIDFHVGPYERQSFLDDPDRGQFDLAVSNVPFGDYSVTDHKLEERFGNKALRRRIHNYFFAKAMTQVVPGGVVAFITSKGTADASDQIGRRVRDHLVSESDFLGGIRFPNTMFKGNAKTSVTTDLLVFRRKDGRDIGDRAKPFVGLKPVKVRHQDYHLRPPVNQGYVEVGVNEWFADNPDAVIGEHSLWRGLNKENEYTVKAEYPISIMLEQRGYHAANLLPDISDLPIGKPQKKRSEPPKGAVPAPPDLIRGNLFMHGGDVYQAAEPGYGVPVEMAKAEALAAPKFIALRDALREVVEYQLLPDTEFDDKVLTAKQKALRTAYDAYVRSHGPLHGNVGRKKAANVFGTDPHWWRVSALEKWDNDEKQVSGLADIFDRRVLYPSTTEADAKAVETPEQALLFSLRTTGGVDLDLMASLLGSTPEALASQLDGAVFNDPHEGWVDAAEYGSGNVVLKLAQAKAAAANDPAFEKNVSFLETVQPEPRTIDRIKAPIGSPWVPVSLYERFFNELTDGRYSIQYASVVGFYKVDTYATGARATEFSVPGMSAGDLFEHMLNGKKPVIKNDGKVDAAATAAARVMAKRIGSEWTAWIITNDPVARAIEKIFNTQVNVFRDKVYDGSHLKIEGMAKTLNGEPIDIRKHQIDGVWRGMVDKTVLYHHEVGTGKTLIMIALAMMLRQTGLRRKPILLTKKANRGQIADTFGQLFPNAKVLVADDYAFSPGRREEFLHRATTGDWDAIIMTHEQFAAITIPEEHIRGWYEEQLQIARDALKDQEDRWTVKRIERHIKMMEERLDKAIREATKSQSLGVLIEQMGIDQIIVDESHAFKKLDTFSRYDGLSMDGSDRATMLLMKANYILSKGGGVAFATGTPVTNSLSELHVIMRFLAQDQLREVGMSAFDDWARTFAEEEDVLERNVVGVTRNKTRFVRWHNFQQLMAMYRRIADVVMADDVAELVRPRMIDREGNVTDAPIVVAAQVNQAQREFFADMLREFKYPPDPDNRLNMLDASRLLRLASIDIRLLAGNGHRVPVRSAPDYEDSKVNMAVRNIYDIWKDPKYAKDKRTQAVFLDMGTPGGALFNLYDDIKGKLVAMGVPIHEIAYAHDANNEDQREELWEKVNRGDVRIVLGSTEKMGVGVNINKRMIAMHHIDPPWRPSDVLQRDGRGIRQGNLFSEGGIMNFQYVTADSFDHFMWTRIVLKSRFINRLLRTDFTEDVVEDIDDEGTFSMAEIESVASGDPRMAMLYKLNSQVNNLELEQEAWFRQRMFVRNNLKRSEEQLALETKHLGNLKFALDVGSKVPEKFEMTVRGAKHTERKTAGEAIKASFKGMDFGIARPVGDWGPWKIDASLAIEGGGIVQVVEVSLVSDRQVLRRHAIRVAPDADPVGITMQITNQVGAIERAIDVSTGAVAKTSEKIASLKHAIENESQEWEKSAELNEKRMAMFMLQDELGMGEGEERGWGGVTLDDSIMDAGDGTLRSSTARGKHYYFERPVWRDAEDDAEDDEPRSESKDESDAIAALEASTKQEALDRKRDKRSERVKPEPLSGGFEGRFEDLRFNLGDVANRRVARRKVPRALGAYFPGPSALTVRFRGDFDTMAHEMGHALDDRFSLLGEWKDADTTPFDDELMWFYERGPSQSDDYPMWQRRAEGVAEFIRAFIVNPAEAILRGPRLTDYIRTTVGEEVWAKMEAVSEAVRRWLGDPSGRVRSIIETEDPDARRKRLGELLSTAMSKENHPDGYRFGWLDWAKYWLTDSLSWLASATRTALKRRGMDYSGLRPSENPMTLATTLAYHDMRFNAMLKHGWIGPDGNLLLNPDAMAKRARIEAEARDAIREVQTSYGFDSPNDIAGDMETSSRMRQELDAIEREMVAARRALYDDPDNILRYQDMFKWFDADDLARFEEFLVDQRVVEYQDNLLKDAEADFAERDLRQRLALAEALVRMQESIAAEESAKLRVRTATIQADAAARIELEPHRRAEHEAARDAKLNNATADAQRIIDTRIAEATLDLNKRYEQWARRTKNRLVKIAVERARRVTPAGGGFEHSVDVHKKSLEAILNSPDAIAFTQAARVYRAIADSMLRYWVAKGRMTRDQYREIVRRNEHYAAMNRFFEEGEVAGDSVGSRDALARRRKLIHRLMGSERSIQSPTARLLLNAHMMMVEADRNEVVARLVDLLDSERKMYEGVPMDLTAIGYKTTQGEKGAITVFRDGVPEYWKFDDKLLKSLNDVIQITNPTIHKILSNTVGVLTKLKRFTATKTPAFAIKNSLADNFGALILTRHGFRVGDHDPRFTADEMRIYEFFGGGMSRRHYLNSPRNYYALRDELMGENGGWWQGVKRIFLKWDDAMSRVEMIPRVAEMRSSLRFASDQSGWSDYDRFLYGAEAARNLQDFARGGKLTKFVSNYFQPFLNSNVQGLMVFGRALFGERGFSGGGSGGSLPPTGGPGAATPGGLGPGGRRVYLPQRTRLRTWARFLIGLGIASIMVVMWNILNGKFEEWRQMPRYLRDMYWVLWNPATGSWVRIAKPYEFGAVDAGITNAVEALAMERDAGKAVGGFTSAVWRTLPDLDALVHGGSFSPLLEVKANRSRFTGRDIVPRHDVGLDFALRNTDSASSFSRWFTAMTLPLGEALTKATGADVRIDPRQTDFLVAELLTQVGRTAIELDDQGPWAIDRVLTGLGVQPPGPQSLGAMDLRTITERYGYQKNPIGALYDAYYESSGKARQDVAKQIVDKSREVAENVLKIETRFAADRPDDLQRRVHTYLNDVNSEFGRERKITVPGVSNETLDELQRIGYAPGFRKVEGLSLDDRHMFEQVQAKAFDEIVSKALKDENYQKRSDERRRKWLETRFDAARERAERELRRTIRERG